jgi:hypothetical protein
MDNRRKDQSGNARASSERTGTTWSYDEAENILFAVHPKPINLATRADIVAYFDEGISFWRDHCKGKRAFIVVDYANLNSNLAEIDFYAAQVKRVIEECAITVVRYNGSMLQRMASRMAAIQLHTASNTYASREEALAVVRGLTRGTIRSAPPP